MKCKYILFFLLLLFGCRQKRVVSPTFYYWKTVYAENKVEKDYLDQFNSNKLYMRFMDVDVDQNQRLIPVAPISFKEKVPNQLQVVPVVFIVNEALKNQSDAQLQQLTHNILWFVKQKLFEAGKYDYNELQIDCDWTVSTREAYFSLLKKIKLANADRKLSVTLRLHQLKNQISSGIPPADKVMLMCYNMGNLRKFGTQNSILDVDELKKYAGKNLAHYPMDIDVALPLFSWAVVFNGPNYIGLSKRVRLTDLKDLKQFARLKNGLYQAKTDLPSFGIRRNQLVRYEESKQEDLKAAAEYLSDYLSEKPINLVYYHLDEQILNKYPKNELEEINFILR